MTDDLKNVNKWYLISLGCGLFPLGLGLLIFFLWLGTRAQWLEVVGIIHLYVGLGSFTIGCFSLAVYFYQARKMAITGIRKNFLRALSLLLSNFPVAAAILFAAFYVLGQSNLLIENHSNTSIDHLQLSEGGRVYKIDSILPKEIRQETFHFQSEGTVYYSFIKEGSLYEGVVFGYVTSGMGTSAKLTITASGDVDINESFTD